MATQKTTVQIVMPAMGESVTEGVVLGWLKEIGDTVELDEPLVEISTDKVDAELPSPAAGVLTKILISADETVEVGAILGELEAGDAPAAPNGDAPAEGNGAAAPASGSGEIVDVPLPEMGESVTEGVVLEVLVKPGDVVAVDEGLAEISTDKVDAELPAPVAGVVKEVLIEADQTIAVGQVLIRIEAGAGAPAQKPAGTPAPAQPAAPAAPADGAADGNATPVAARAAATQGVDVSKLTGTGRAAA